ncbi:MAG TPA: cytochrome C552 [Deltaproteobacteria bacterium]|nr:cytochrome C552 [Deltaproteobacteria bacterium]
MKLKDSELIKYVIGLLSLILFAALTAVGYVEVKARSGKSDYYVSAKNQDCIDCHLKKSVGEGGIRDWMESRHAAKGIGCFECHGADKEDADAFEHEGDYIAVVVTPKDCARCHKTISEEFQASRHAGAAGFIDSLDNVLGNIIEGPAAADSGCRQCHGSVVRVLEDGRLDPATWPNSGMGRINPDGSKGSCSACHGRHRFSKAQARQPENCGKCHMGPDHPQIEIYNESKHGILYRANIDDMNLDNPKEKWIAGRDYQYPTCVTCHMSATDSQPLTHDVGKRISWTLRPEVSIKLDDWEKKRKAMKDVCTSCHSPEYVDNFYVQYDSVVTLYNEKFGRPAKEAMEKLRSSGKLTPTPFDEKIEWTYFELWHHEGRRARMGASMMGPDFTQWHGFYEVAKHFYNEFIPELRELDPALAYTLLSADEHRWRQGLSREQIEKTIDFYRKRYSQ